VFVPSFAMSRLKVDVAVLGSGFGGSLLSLILKRLGKRVAVIDKASHPRFSIGESSTPLADFVLSDLAKRYDLASVLPLSSFGSWRKAYPGLRCGLKRGFSYFGHERGQPFNTDCSNANQLLVAASSNDTDSDTHWHRGDVDGFLFQEAVETGVDCFENTVVTEIQGRGEELWQLKLPSPTGLVVVDADFIVDATGAAGVLLRHLGIADETHRLRTNSAAIYSHFDSVRTFASVLDDAGVDTKPHPYACDNAALHHVLEDGWMWNLRFSDGLVSAGFAIDLNRERSGASSVEADWEARLESYPTLAAQFANAASRPGVGLIRTNRMQRLASAAGGSRWLVLPHTAGFIDPLHSTGIAHTLSAIERIADMFTNDGRPPDAAVQCYSAAVRSELMFVDELVSGCYAALPNFRLFTAWCMLYFASAHSCEMRRIGGETAFANGFLGAAIGELRTIARDLRHELTAAAKDGSVAAIERFERQLATAIAPFNSVGLCDPAVKNMYANTAPPRGLGGT
jgi:FADH2 O2-dependent halogenase